jgi:putative transcriptional regulator
MHKYRQVQVVLDDFLKRKNLTRYRLAQDSGISENQLSRFATQKTNAIKYETLASICDILDCEIGDIIKLVPRK